MGYKDKRAKCGAVHPTRGIKCWNRPHDDTEPHWAYVAAEENVSKVRKITWGHRSSVASAMAKVAGK